MNPNEIVEQLQHRFGEQMVDCNLETIDPFAQIAPEAIHDVSLFCRDSDRLRFDYLKNMSAVDYLITDPKKAKKLEIEPHLEVVYHLFSFVHHHDFTLKVCLPRWKEDKDGELPELPSVSDVWRAADWHEREIYDLMGIVFRGHPELRRILCPEDWEGHPLRKDYVFPLEYHGIRCQ